MKKLKRQAPYLYRLNLHLTIAHRDTFPHVNGTLKATPLPNISIGVLYTVYSIKRATSSTDRL